MKKKVTKHVVGDVGHYLRQYIDTHKEEKLEVSGVEFSNLGAQGREPLFDVSYDQKGTIMAYWKDECKNCIVISAPEPGFEIKAPKSLCNYFRGWRLSYLDVSHLDVSHTTDFSQCFRQFGSLSVGDDGVSSKIIGLEAWDVSEGRDFSFMFDYFLPSNKAINLNLSSWQFNQKTRISFWGMFKNFGPKADEIILDVNGWNVTKGYDFDWIFGKFAPHAKAVELKGVENWRLGTNLASLDHAFDDFAKASSCRLDLSGWSAGCTQKPSMEDFSKGVFFRIKEPRWN